ncbi:MAG: SMP-30/gluconolactonase/LRE family protein [Acidimicrobiia bacterium]
MPSDLRVLTDGWAFLESPRWRDGRFWISDFYTHAVLAVTLDGAVEEMARVPAQPSGLGWLPDGTPLVVSMRDRKVVRIGADGTLSEHADLNGVLRGWLNDMVVDDRGRAYVGSFGYERDVEPVVPSGIALVEADGSTRLVADDLYFPNGMVITPDGTLVVAESRGNRLTAFDIAPDGSLSGRREWARFADPPAREALETALETATVAADGLALDAEGCIWVADAAGWRAIRVREGGEIVDAIADDGFNVFACGLGGDDGRTLALCLSPAMGPATAANPRARLAVVEVDVAGAGRPFA